MKREQESSMETGKDKFAGRTGCGRSLLLLVLKGRVVLSELGELRLLTLVGVALAGRCGRG
jgi:hypothetical protein